MVSVGATSPKSMVARRTGEGLTNRTLPHYLWDTCPVTRVRSSRYALLLGVTRRSGDDYNDHANYIVFRIVILRTTSGQLKISNPRCGGRIHAKTANYGLVVVYIDRS